MSAPAADGDVRLRGLQPADLVVENLLVHYGGVQAVRGISFVVGAGESVGIIGANGAGKTPRCAASLA